MINLIPRNRLQARIERALQRAPVAALLGPRQCGKTTMARLFKPDAGGFFDAENQGDLNRLADDAIGLLSSYEGLVVIDEIQMMPQLFRHLRVLADDPTCRARFLITGSASPELAERTSQTLAGRVELVTMAGLDAEEIRPGEIERLWVRGGFPRSFLSESDDDSVAWRESFVSTWVLRDIARLAEMRVAPVALARLLRLIADYHGQFWNRAKAAETTGLDSRTVQNFVDTLAGAHMLRLLPPFARNTGKRIRKAPKLYLRDSGVLHRLLAIDSAEHLRTHMRCGASWEGFGIEQIARVVGEERCSVFSPHVGTEVDLVVEGPNGPVGFEFKANRRPTIPSGTQATMNELGIDRVYIVHQGDDRNPISDRIRRLPAVDLLRVAREIC